MTAQQIRALRAIMMVIGFERTGFYLFLAVYVLYRVSLGDTKELASEAVGAALGWVYGSAFIGGFLGQRIGFRQTALAGLLLLSSAYAALAFGVPQWLWMFMLAVSIGMFKPIVPILVGKITAKDEKPVQDSAMAQYYAAVNVGGFLGPLIAGALVGSYQAAFLISAACCAMAALLLVINWKALADQPTRPISEQEAVALALGGAARRYRKNHIRLVFLCFMGVCFWTGYNAFFGRGEQWIKDAVDRLIRGWEIPVPWFTAENGLIILVAGFLWPTLMATWRMGSRILAALALSMLVYAILVLFDGRWIAPAAIAGAVVFIETVAEMCISPLGLSRITALSPPQYVGWYTALWFLSSAIGGRLSGMLSFSSMLCLMTGGTVAAAVLRKVGVFDQPPTTETETSVEGDKTSARSPGDTAMVSSVEL